MHEFSMTERLIEAVLHEAEKRGAKRVVEVRLSIGKLMFLGLEQVKFAYATLVRGTILEGSKLMIEEDQLYTTAVELIHQQHLVGILSSQPIWTMHIKPVNGPRSYSVTQTLQGRTNKSSTTIAIINEAELLFQS